MTRPTPRLRLEHLEDRITPTVWNIPWTDGAHVTVSFAPDGTNVDGAPSQLYQKMAGQGLSQSVWQGEILRALQTWSGVTNIDFSVVADDGSASGPRVPCRAMADSGTSASRAAPCRRTYSP